MSRRAFVVFFAAVVAFPIGAIAANNPPAHVDFNFQIRPLLSDRCFKCHGPDEKSRKAKLRLDIPDGATAVIDKKTGAQIIAPGKPEKSEVIRRITTTDPDDHMPPPDSNLSLNKDEIALIRTWIEQGAKYKTHWAFIPVGKAQPLKIKSDRAQNGIDQFVLARLERENIKPLTPTLSPSDGEREKNFTPKSSSLISESSKTQRDNSLSPSDGERARERGKLFQPSPEADKTTLIRRLSFDLTGLPPSVTDVDTFLGDKSSRAYEKLVDRLLASPAYGERMANDWLDLARYADTYGYQADVDRDMSPWRDWVIRAFNRNLPYDKFVTWQIAGDLLPNATDEQILATAFNRLHRQTNEGGSIEEEFRVEYVSDRVHTMGTAMLGLTLECSRCHDHKYDPIKQKNYYQLSAFFNNIDESGLYSHFTRATPSPTLLLYAGDSKKKHEQLKQQIVAREKSLPQIAASAKKRFEEWLISEGRVTRVPDLTQENGTRVTRPSEVNPIAAFDFENVADSKTPSQVGTNFAKLLENPRPVEGRVGKALKFDGENSVTFKGIGDFTRTDPFSFSLWLKPAVKQDRAVVLHHSRAWTDSGSRGYELVLDKGRPTFALIHFWPGNAIGIRAHEELPLNEWTHLTLTYDGSSRANGLKIFRNGEEMKAEVLRDNLYKDIVHRKEWNDAEAGKIELTLAARFRDSGFKNGLIDEFKVFDRELTAVEVRGIASGLSGASFPVSVSERDSVLDCASPLALSNRPLHVQSGRGLPQSKTSRQFAALFEFYLHRHDHEYQTALAELKKLRDAENDLANDIPEIMVMKEMPQRRQTFLLKRGAYDAPDEPVEPGTPESIFPFSGKFPKNRLGFAQWLIDRRNPLTARVAVNRIWAMHFGRGLVATPENFGSQGQLPTHPELLDWLAKKFMDGGWDVKAMHKLIVTSATYRQSSVAPPELIAADPDNRLLARGPKQRLSAEQIRDAALAVSGLLSRKIGGLSVKPYQPAGLWEESGTGKTYTQDHGESLYRRSLYTFWRRTAPPPSMLTFDATSREVCTARRPVTATPLQALTLLNDPQFNEAARALAEKILRDGGNLNAEIEIAFQTVLCRKPENREREILRQLYDEQLQFFSKNPEAAEKYLATGERPPDKMFPANKLAATTVLTSALMNHDEFVMER